MLQAKKNHGAALLTALFIITLVAIATTAMMARFQLDIYRSQLAINQDKLYLASQAVTFWAIAELNNPKNHFNKLLKNAKVAIYPKNMQTLQKNIKITGALYDLQAQFNLNNLLQKKYAFNFINLLNEVPNKRSNDKNIDLTLGILDWINDYDPGKGKDSFASYYFSQRPAYYASHQLLQSKSELRLIKNFSQKQYLALEPLITVLPEPTPVNINTASKEVLMSLGNGISKQQIQLLLEERASKEITNLAAIQNLLKKIRLPNSEITVESNYFLSVAMVNNEEMNLRVYTLFHRNRNKLNKISVNILRMSFNEF